jgi:sporulation protein YunB
MKKQTARRIHNFLLFLIVCFITLSFLSFLESRFTPIIKEISHMYCTSYANKIIDSALNDILTEKEQNTTNLILYDIHEDTYTADTMQVNRFCAALSEKITDSLSDLPHEQILIPFGAVFGSAFLSDKGPLIPFTIYPSGNVITNFESEFLSAGINQVNYKIWLNISVELKIVNPIYKEDLKLSRKILLADIIFNGKVPEHYFQMKSSDEYLLTE